MTETLTLGEVFRLAVMSRHGARNELRTTPLFAGKSADGVPLTGENHAYFLPRDRDGDMIIDTVDVYLPRMFSHEEYAALRSVERLYHGFLGLAADAWIDVVFAGEAEAEIARRWRSATPFILPRFEKRRGPPEAQLLSDTPDEQIRRELAHRNLTPTDVRIDRGMGAFIGYHGGRSVAAGSYRRLRRGDRGMREAVTATLTFDEVVGGPIAIGYYAHFGLGQFVPDESGG